MKPIRSILATSIALLVLANTSPALTLPVSEDTSTSSTPALARSAGAGTSLHVSASRHGLIRFEAGAFSDSIAAGDVSKARLVLFLSKVSAPGALTIHRITEQWSEDGTGTPAYDPTPIATIPRSSVVAKQFVIIDVTKTVHAWLSKPASDFGFAIVSSSGATIQLGAKEGPATGYPAQLQIETDGISSPADSGDGPVGSVDRAKIPGKKLVDGSVFGIKLAPATVTGDKIANATIGSANLASGLTLAGTTSGTFSGNGAGLTGVTATPADGSVTTSKLADGAVSTAKLASASVTNTQLATGSVNSATIQDGTVAEGDLTAAVQTKLNNIGGGGPPTGAAGGSLAGNYPNPTLASNSVGTSQLANSSVTSPKLAANLTLSGDTTVTGSVFSQDSSTLFAQSAAGFQGQANGVQFDSFGGAGVIIEDGSAGESGGFFANGNTAAIWSPGDTGAIVSFYDEDNFPADGTPGTPLSFISSNAGEYVVGNSSFGNDVTVNGNTFLGAADDTAVAVDGTGFARLGFVKRSGSNPVIASASGQPILFSQSDQAGLLDNISSSTLTEQMRIDFNGNVGINTPNPSAKLTVVAPGSNPGAPGGHVALIEDGSTGGGVTAGLAIKSPFVKTNTNGSDNFITFFDANNSSMGSIEGNGASGVTLNTSGGDYAEYLPKTDPAEQFKAGEIVGVRDGRVVAHGAEAEQFMVITDRASVSGNSPGEDPAALAKHCLVAFIGQVPVQVLGPVHTGDFILASEKGDGTGIAMPAASVPASAMHRVIGRAWEASSETGIKIVKAAVGLDRTSVIVPALERLDRENRELRAQVAALEARDQAREARLTRLEHNLDDRPARTVRASLDLK